VVILVIPFVREREERPTVVLRTTEPLLASPCGDLVPLFRAVGR
jgi:hypothetical protein